MRDIIWAKKKLFLVALVFAVLSIILSGCRDLYAGRRPYDYIDSVWICEAPYITFCVTEDNYSTAYIEKGEHRIAIDLLFGYGTDIEAVYEGEGHINDETLLFRGECKFGSKRFIIYLIEDNYWNGKYKQLVFNRVE